MKNLKSIFLLAIMFIACQTVLAQTDKGIEYYNNKDYANAVKCFQQAAEQGDAISQNYMGECYFYGNGVTKNLQEAAKWYRKAAVQGNANAQNSLGYCYENGEGVTKDLQEAVKWYRKAAEQGYANAQRHLGYCYNYGEGVTKDLQEAVKWYRKAAEQGDAVAQYNLGNSYAFGEGVTKNFQEAVKWYQKAADNNGNAKGKYLLGLCYYHGRGVTRDIQKGESLIREAAYDGLDEAKEKLDDMRTADADRRGNALLSAYIRKYGKRAAAAMDKCQPYVGMSEGALRDFAFASQDGNFNPFLFQGVIGAYKIYKPNGYLRILNAGNNLHLRYPSVVYVRNGRVSALKW